MISDEQWEQQQKVKEERHIFIWSMCVYSLYFLLTVTVIFIVNIIDLEPVKIFLKIDSDLGIKFLLVLISYLLLWIFLFFATLCYIECRDFQKMASDKQRRQNNQLLQKIGGEQYVTNVV
jgi:hypothetical protein